MKNTILIICLICFLQGCNSGKNNNNIFGKYFNYYEEDAIHYVVLKKDSTFFHSYIKKGGVLRINKGVFKIKKKNQEVEILFDTWNNFGYKKLPVCNNCLFYAKIKDGELIFNTDLPKEANFIKE